MMGLDVLICCSFTSRKVNADYEETFSVVKVMLLALMCPSVLSLELNVQVLPPLFVVLRSGTT